MSALTTHLIQENLWETVKRFFSKPFSGNKTMTEQERKQLFDKVQVTEQHAPPAAKKELESRISIRVSNAILEEMDRFVKQYGTDTVSTFSTATKLTTMAQNQHLESTYTVATLAEEMRKVAKASDGVNLEVVALYEGRKSLPNGTVRARMVNGEKHHYVKVGTKPLANGKSRTIWRRVNPRHSRFHGA